jgi:TFIIF-interacting CTD phosphatase-like protein
VCSSDLKFKKGLDILRKAQIYAQRIDWLVSGDDGEDYFHSRLKNDLMEWRIKDDVKFE